jgi:signal transduction histidine kinase/CheY-like chemotaxis protein
LGLLTFKGSYKTFKTDSKEWISLKKIRKTSEDINSTVARLSLVAIQVIIGISAFQFFRFIFFHGRADWKSILVPFAISLVSAMAAFLLLCKYQKLIKEFSLQNESLEKAVRAEEERRKLEVQMMEAQRLESLGVLTGGIAHDFNNLLMVILGNAELAINLLSPTSRARPKVKDIIRASERAADLCRQMLAYSGKGRFVVGRHDLSEIVQEMVQMLEVSISKKASLRYSFAAELPAVQADVTELRQVIMNLVTNASESLGDESGVISISTGVLECDRAYLHENHLGNKLSEGSYVYLEVSDTGCGMDEETQRRIFDPFFTTKFIGRGLGLAAVVGIVRGHDGAVEVHSEPGQGTSFKILLPAFAWDQKETAQSTTWDAPLPSGETILFVDDESEVRDVGAQMLAGFGFKILTAANGQEGLEVFRKHQDEIKCVILDLTMPEMGGEEVFRELRRLRSDLCVILSSGYSEEDVTQRFAGKGLGGFVQKPYTSAKLRMTLNHVLRSR